ncbi:hypothetical protein ACVWV0_001576 [Ewingella americana]
MEGTSEVEKQRTRRSPRPEEFISDALRLQEA